MRKSKQSTGKTQAQYDLDAQIAKISALSSGKGSKHNFFNLQRCFTRKWPATKSCYSENIWLLGKELKAQTDIAKKHYQNLDNMFSCK